MDRKEIQMTLLDEIDKIISEKGEDYEMMFSPCIGKCVWTAKEFRDAIKEDKCLEDHTYNPIDARIRFINYKNDRSVNYGKY